VAFGAGAEQDLGDRQADQFGVGQLGWVAWSQAWAQQVVDGDVQCGDEVVEVAGVKVIVDPMSLRYLEGAEVDYKEDLMGGGFAIKNPNATSTCGCGHSFNAGGEGAGEGGGHHH